VVVGLPVEAEAVGPPQREGRVAHEVVPVVVVPLAAGNSRKGRGRRRRDRAARRVFESPERERGALQLRAPGVVWELAAREPVAPVVSGVGHQPERVVEALRSPVLRPRQRDVRGVVLAERRAGGGARALEADAQVGVELERDRRAVRVGDGLVVGGAGVAPLGALQPVLEDGLALEAELDQPLRAACCADEHVVGLPVRRRPPLPVGTLLHAGLPRGLEDHAPGQVAAGGRDLDVGRPEPEAAGVAVEDRGEHARRVELRQAQPLHVPAGRHQRGHLAVR